MLVPRTGGAHDIDAALVRRARAGDPAGLRALVERTYPLVRRWARGWAPDEAEADDLTQDVMVRMLRSLHTYRASARFTTWLYTVTRSVARDHHRSASRRARRDTEHGARALLGEAGSLEPLDRVDAERLGAALETLFRELPDRQREVFDLVELQGYNAREVGELLGIEAVSVRAHLHKARRTLRGRLLDGLPHLVPDML